MNTGKKVKNILFIALSIFISNHLIIILGKVFKDQFFAILPNYYYRTFAFQIVQAFLTVALILIFHKTSVFKLNGKVLKEGFFCSLPLITTYSLIMLLGFSKNSGNQLISKPEIICSILNWFLIGVAEEGLFRGIVHELFADIFVKTTRKGVYLAIAASSVVFGLCHLTNLFAPGISVAAVVLQVASAMAIGMVLCAIKFRSHGSIWPSIVLHALIDASGFIYGGLLWGGTEVDSVNNLDLRGVFMIPILIGLAIFLMRKEKTNNLIQA